MRRLIPAILIFSVTALVFVAGTWFLTASSTSNPQLSLYAEIIPAESNTNANFSFILRGIALTSQSANSSGYTLTTTAQGTQVHFHLLFNSTDTFPVTITGFENNSTSSPYPRVAREIPTGLIRTQNLTVYIEYTAHGSWLLGTLPLYRDAYLFEPGFDSAINFSTTEPITLLYFLAAGASLPVSAAILAAILPEWRRQLTAYFPWITYTLSFIMLWGFIFIGNPIDYERSLGILPDIFSTIPHFSTDHLLGNLTRGFIISGVLLESWVGYAERNLLDRRIQLLASMLLMDTSSSLVSYLGSTFEISILQIGGFGASYTVEVWATILMIAVLTRQDILERTDLLHKLYPLLAAISGFALLNYVYEWFLAGFVLGGGAVTTSLATNHIIAFFLGLLIIALFYGLGRLASRLGFRRRFLDERPADSGRVVASSEVEDNSPV